MGAGKRFGTGPRPVSAPISGVKTESSADLTERTELQKAMDRAAAQAEEARRTFDQLRRAAEDFDRKVRELGAQIAIRALAEAGMIGAASRIGL